MRLVASTIAHAIYKRSTIPMLALATTLLAPGPAMAQLPKRPGLQSICTCLCSGPYGYSYNDYNIKGACGQLNNRTCNFEDPNTGGIVSGKLRQCGLKETPPAGLLRRKG